MLVMHPKGDSKITKEDIYMRTVTHRKFYHFSPDPANIKIEDIAHSLANLCRFMGHTPWHYSVAQHSIYVDDVVLARNPDVSKSVRLWAITHDAAEAYGGDLHRCAKRQLHDYMRMMKRIEAAVCIAFDLPIKEPPEVKIADGILLSTELVQLMREKPHIEQPWDFKIPRWYPALAKRKFLERFHQIMELPC